MRRRSRARRWSLRFHRRRRAVLASSRAPSSPRQDPRRLLPHPRRRPRSPPSRHPRRLGCQIQIPRRLHLPPFRLIRLRLRTPTFLPQDRSRPRPGTPRRATLALQTQRRPPVRASLPPSETETATATATPAATIRTPAARTQVATETATATPAGTTRTPGATTRTRAATIPTLVAPTQEATETATATPAGTTRTPGATTRTRAAT